MAQFWLPISITELLKRYLRDDNWPEPFSVATVGLPRRQLRGEYTFTLRSSWKFECIPVFFPLRD